MSFFKSAVAILLHSASVAVMAWGYNNLENTILNSFVEKQYGGHSQFLTVQALLIALFTMVLSLCADLLSWNILKQTKRAFFMIALPLAVVVSSIYWTLLLFFPSLIFQPIPGAGQGEGETVPSSSSSAPPLARIPLSLDLALHATPALTLLADFFLFEKSYGKTAASVGATVMSAAFGVWYASWVEHCASRNGDWFPYPFLTYNTFPGRVAIYVVVTAVAFMSFRGINNLHARITGRVPGRKGKTS